MDFKDLKDFNFNSKFLPWIVGGAVAVLVLAGAGGYFYYKSTQAAKTTPQNQQQAQEEVRKLVLEVGKLIELPTGETPTVATVTDIEKLRNQLFFQKAKNGDKVLIYTQARKAILYDSQAKKIIDVAPINIGTNSAVTRQTAEQVPQPKIVLRNGTSTVGLTTKVETELKKTYPQLNVVDKENASRSDYAKTLIMVLNDRGKDLASNLAKLLKTDIVSEASGEAKPKDVDILVILGKDRI